jgi:iron complex transport system substrate-binding protein
MTRRAGLLLVLLAGVANAAGPARVVTLAPNLTELVFAAGAGERLVGAVAFSDYPSAAKRLPVVGDALRLDLEKLLTLHPDLILAWADGTQAAAFEQLERLGVPVLRIETTHLADIPKALRALGALFGTEAVAETVARRFETDIAELGARHLGLAPLRVFYQVWDEPLYTLGGRHVATELLALCGAQNVYAQQAQGAFIVSLEAVYAAQPEVLVLAGSAKEQANWRSAWQRRPPLPPVASGAVIGLDPDLANRMGPRIAQGARALCAGLDHLRERH